MFNTFSLIQGQYNGIDFDVFVCLNQTKSSKLFIKYRIHRCSLLLYSFFTKRMQGFETYGGIRVTQYWNRLYTPRLPFLHIIETDYT